MAVALAVLLVEVALPRLVEQRLRASLRARGIEAHLEVTRVGLTRTTIRRISLPAQRLEIDEATLRYSVLDLVAGRIDTLAIGEARVELPLVGASAAVTNPGAAWSPPLDRIEVASLTAVMTVDGRPWRTRWTGAVAREADRFAVDLRVASAGGPPASGTVSGTMDLSRSAADIPFTLEVDLDAPSLLVRAAARYGVSLDAPSPIRARASGTLGRTAGRWGADVDAATLRATAAALSAAGRHAVGDVALDLAWSGRVDGDGASLTVRPDSALTAARLRSTGKTLELRSAAQQAATLTVTAPARAAVSFDGVADRWSVSAPKLRLRTADLEVTTPDLHTVVAELDVPLWLEASPEDTRAGFLEGGTIDSERGRLTIAGRRIAFEPVALRIPASDGAAYRSDDDELRLELAARRAFRVSAAPGAMVRSLNIEARATLANATPQLTSAVVTVAGGGARLGDVEVGSMTVRAPFRWERGQRRNGDAVVRVRDATWRGHAVPPISGRIETRRGRRRFVGSMSEPNGLEMAITAALDRRRPEALVISASAPRFVVRRHDRAGQLLRALLGMEVEGALALEAQLVVADGDVRAEGHLSLADVALTARDDQLAVRGLRGDVWLAPPGTSRSRVVQTLGWRSAVIAGQPLGPGTLKFSLPSRRALHVRKAAIAAGGGTISLAPFVIDPMAKAVRARVHLAGLDMQRWLPVVSRGRLTGTGTFDGEVALELATDGWSLSLGKGRIATRGRGRLQVQDRELLDGLASRAASTVGAAVRDVIKQRLVIALADFDYQDVTLDLFEGCDRELTLSARGRGHRIAQEVALTVNATGVLKALNVTRPDRCARYSSASDRPRTSARY